MSSNLISESLKDRVAIVTGSARGIGNEIALKLTNNGANVLINGTNEERTKRAAEELQQQSSNEVMYFAGDLSKEQNVIDMVDSVIRKWGRIDILVNNAGGGVIRPFLEHTAETLETTINRNLWTAVWCSHKVLPHMVENNYGRIVNVGADSVRNGLWEHAAYNAAKGGMHAMTTGLAREFASYDITVNTVAPPAVNCIGLDEIRQRDAELVDRYISIIPKGRAAEMAEVADAVWYLTTDNARFITGQVISVNGGSNML